MIRTVEEHLAHYGTPRKSGRYPWGSGGGTQKARNRSFLDMVASLKKDGMTDTQISDAMGMTTTQWRARRSIAVSEQRQSNILQAQRYKDKGWSNMEIGRRMGQNESTIRSWLAPGAKDKADALQTTASTIKAEVDKKRYLDVGVGVEHQLGIPNSRLNNAVAVLKELGYKIHVIKQQQLTTGKFTTMKVLTPPDVTLQEVQRNRSKIQQFQQRSLDHGRSFIKIEPPMSMSSRRIAINYKEDGGDKADGVIYVRPGVDKLRIGSNRYGQVRILVDGTHYLKGMAVYKDDLPTGTDIVFNTKKSNTGKKKDAMNEIEPDPDMPFGSIIRQVPHPVTGKNSSVMNMVGSPTKEGSGEEGSWDTWSKNLPSQMLSKQSPKLAQQQLDLTYERRQREFAEIMSLTNPTVRRDLLEKFADQTDSAAVHLKAANMPRQATKVILPIPSMKPTEVYAPTFRDGERVALIRFPHGGTFEIPELTVNNRNREARRMLGTASKDGKHDSIGINHLVAERLSGADFDGDTVIVIPNNKGSLKITPALEGLKGFDPQDYKLAKDSPIPRMDSQRKGFEMGKISNLIADMAIKGGGDPDEIARAIRHSMVVIDAHKHGLDFKQSEKDNGILALKEKYQGKKDAGAATLISRASARYYVPERIPRPARRGGPIDPVTGKKVYEETGRQVSKRRIVKDPVTGRKKKVETGVMEDKTVESKQLAETEDAFALSSGTRIEAIYAAHSNRLKAMANDARKAAVSTKALPYSPSAKKVYKDEVDSLNAKLHIALKNAPYERQAQLVAAAVVAQKRQANPNMEPEEVKKLKQQQLYQARITTGAQRQPVDLTQSEWDAIQAGAITKDKLEKILRFANPDTVKKLAMPKHTPKLTSTMMRRAQSMLASGATQAEVADALGIGLTTLKVGLSE